ncbi:hypothetical protein K0M31_013143 [Melipona bicolor]|uniref:Uncharacterized protein n=1 Tax=Melipona bicolor TaxID=60889 RepID=A0AA40FII2_9HYME|nr:hypothetical protein K0M31_013143 [Melipona bicolor]
MVAREAHFVLTFLTVLAEKSPVPTVLALFILLSSLSQSDMLGPRGSVEQVSPIKQYL